MGCDTNNNEYFCFSVVCFLIIRQRWSFSSICDEYQAMAAPKPRALDKQFIELFDLSQVGFDPRYVPSWLPWLHDASLPLDPEPNPATAEGDGEKDKKKKKKKDKGGDDDDDD